MLICGYSNTLIAQNLVPNGSFEEAIICPSFVGNLSQECGDWYASLLFPDSSETTPDWFHECSDNNLLTPPDVAFGTQIPFDGGGYAGLVALSLVNVNRRELIAVELIEPLTIGSTYLIEFQASNFYFPDYVVASNRLGFNFSTHPYYNLNNFPLNTSHYSELEILPATGEWHSITQMFVADSAYQYIHIGNFYDDENTDYIAESQFPDLSYYAIDSVSVSHVLSNGINDNIDLIVQMFPNPASQHLNIVLPTGQTFEDIRVYDSTGNQVIKIEHTQHDEQKSISVSSLSKGVFFLQIVTPKTTYYEKFIKN